MKKLAILFIIQIIVTTNFVYSQGKMVFNGEKENLRGRHIRDIEEDANGNIWLLTSPGGVKADKALLCQYTAKGDWFYFKDNKKIYGHKFNELNIENDNIMACYYEKGIFIFDGYSWKNLTKKTIMEEFNLPRKEIIFKIRRDSLNRIWVETSKGLLLCQNNSYKRYLEDIDFEGTWTLYLNGHVYSASGVYQFIDNDFVKIIDTGYENLRFKGSDNQNRNCYSRIRSIALLPIGDDFPLLSEQLYHTLNKNRLNIELIVRVLVAVLQLCSPRELQNCGKSNYTVPRIV